MRITNIYNSNENKTIMSTNYETGNLNKFYSSQKFNNKNNQIISNNYINTKNKNQFDFNNTNLLDISEKIDNININVETNTRETS
jgi:hypothetical protein